MMKRKLLLLKENRIPFLITAIFVLSLLLFFHSCMYFFSDDAAIVEILREGFDGTSHPNSIFLSPLLSSILYFLYQSLPSFPWLFLFILLFQSIGLFVGIKILYCISHNKVSKIISIGGFILLCHFFFLHISFTSMSLFLWFIGVTALVWNSYHSNKHIVSYTCIGLLLAISILTRPSIFLIALLISLPGIVFFLLNSSRAEKKRFLLSMIPLLIISFCIGFTEPFHNAMLSNHKSVQKDRSLLIDTHLIKNSQQEIPFLSFTQEDIYMIGSWWSHDEKIYNHLTLNRFIMQHFNLFKLWNWKDGWHNLPLNILFWLFILLAVFIFRTIPNHSIHFSSTDSPKKSHFFFVLFLLYIMLCTIGISFIRYPPRVYFTIFPFLYIVSFLLSCSSLTKYSSSTVYQAISILIIFFVSGGFILLTVSRNHQLSSKAIYSKNVASFMNTKYPSESKYLQIPVINTFVHPWANTSYLPKLHIIPEGWLIQSPYYYQYLESIGIKRGRDLCLKTINNTEYIFFFWSNAENPFSQLQHNMEKHFTKHYSSLFGGQSINIKIIEDFRFVNHTGDKTGWVFFYFYTQ